MDHYFVLIMNDNDTLQIQHYYNKKSLLTDVSTFDGNFLSKMPMEWDKDDILIIKGKIVTPKPVQSKYDI